MQHGSDTAGPGAAAPEPTGPAAAGSQSEQRAGTRGARQEAEATASTVKHSAGHAAEHTRREINQLVDDARHQVMNYVQRQKEAAAEDTHAFAGAVRQVAEDLQEQGRRLSAQYAEYAAEEIDRLASALSQRDFEDIMNDIESFARRRPALFLGGAVAAGFLLGRVLKASSESKETSTEEAASAEGTTYPVAADRSWP